MATGLSSTVQKGSDIIKDYTCSACNDDEAKHYCGECNKFFCDSCVKLHNQLFRAHILFGRGQMGKWPVAKATLDLIEMCTEHKDKKIELFCEDHSQLCCHTCIALHHRQCSKVTLVADAANNTSVEDVNQLLAVIKATQEQLQQQNKYTESSLQEIETTYGQILLKITELRRTINAALDKLEQHTRQELDDLTNNITKSLQKRKDNCTKFQGDLQCLSDAIKDVGHRGNELYFVAHTKCLKLMEQTKVFLKDMSVNIDAQWDFIFNEDISQFLSALTGLGKIGRPNQVMYVQSKLDKLIKLTSDTNTCTIQGICQLPSGLIVIVDTNDKRAKLVDNKYNVIHQCQFSTRPFDVCYINQSEVAVSVDDSQTHEIQFLSVKDGMLVKGKTLQLPHSCSGIAHHQDTLYVTADTALYQYTLTGKLVKKIYEDGSGKFTVWKCAVSTGGDRIYITNRDHHQLVTLNKDGEIISTFTDPELTFPFGVHVTPAGQVLVCGRSSNTIVQVNSEGREKLSAIVTQRDGLSEPISVCYDRNTDSVIIGQYENDNILVYKIKQLLQEVASPHHSCRTGVGLWTFIRYYCTGGK